jgi:hypothetical protein
MWHGGDLEVKFQLGGTQRTTIKKGQKRTTDLREAKKFSYIQARMMCRNSEEGWIAYPVEYVEKKIQSTVPMKSLSTGTGRQWKNNFLPKDRAFIKTEKNLK